MQRPPSGSRRELLASLAGVTTALAGCVTAPGSPTRTRSPTPTEPIPSRSPTATPRTATDTGSVHPPGTTVQLPDGSVTLRSFAVRLGVVYPGQWMTRFASPDGEQFLVANLDRSREESTPKPLRDAVTLRLDERTDTPARPGEHYAPTYGPDGRLYFRVPRGVDVDEGRLRWTGADGTTVRWRVPETVRRRLRLTPSFELAEFAVGEATLQGSGMEATAKVGVTLRVRNDGERRGVFVGLVNLPSSEYVHDYHPSRAVSFPVPAGETVTWRRQVSWEMPARGSSSVGLASVAGGGNRRIELPTPTGTPG